MIYYYIDMQTREGKIRSTEWTGSQEDEIRDYYGNKYNSYEEAVLDRDKQVDEAFRSI